MGAVGEARLGRGRGALARLEEFRATVGHAAHIREPDQLAFTAYVCEVTEQLVLENQADALLFTVVRRAITNVLDHGAQAWILRQFELGLLQASGLLPQLDACWHCGQVLVDGARRQRVTFHPDHGVACTDHNAPGSEISAKAAKLAVELIAGAALTATPKTNDEPFTQREEGLDWKAVPRTVRRDLRDLSYGLVRQHLRRPLRSVEFLAALTKAARVGPTTSAGLQLRHVPT